MNDIQLFLTLKWHGNYKVVSAIVYFYSIRTQYNWFEQTNFEWLFEYTFIANHNQPTYNNDAGTTKMLFLLTIN